MNVFVEVNLLSFVEKTMTTYVQPAHDVLVIIINFISNDWDVKYVTSSATMDPKL
jgi:hypothetical protein